MASPAQTLLLPQLLQSKKVGPQSEDPRILPEGAGDMRLDALAPPPGCEVHQGTQHSCGP